VVRADRQRWGHLARGLFLASTVLAWAPAAVAAEVPLQVAQYAHTSWTRNSTKMGLVFAMAQTPDGYLWLAGSYGLFRFDGVRFVKWEPPDGQSLPSAPYSLLAARDGTLWIGTFAGLSSWDGRKLTRQYPEMQGLYVTSLLEDGDGTIWAGLRADPGRLCAIRAGQVRCSTLEGRFGGKVWSLGKDASGTLWVGSDSGVWRWSPGTPQRYEMPPMRVDDLTTTPDGRILVGMTGGGLWQVAGDRLVPYPVPGIARPDAWLADGEVQSNKLLRDRDGGLWIGTASQGLLHVKDGRTDAFTRADGLSGNVSCGLFEDHEGNIWYSSDKGLDRFRRLPVTTVSTKQGLPDEVAKSVLATTDGSLWAATNNGLARWKDGRLIVYSKRDGLPDSHVQAQYQDAEGRLWVGTARGLAYFAAGRFVAVDGGPSDEIYSMTGDAAGNLWLAGNKGLAHLQRGLLVDNTPWSKFGHESQAQVIVADRGGLWLSFWDRRGVLYFKDGKIEANYMYTDGPGWSAVLGLRLDADGAMWVGTDKHGIARIQDGRIAMLSTADGLPCDKIYWSVPDDHGSMWMYGSCGLIRVPREDLAGWIADPRRRVAATLWDGQDGVPPVATAEGYFNPSVTRGADGRLWFLAGVELLWIDPDHIPSNSVPPPVHVESLVADHRTYPAQSGLRLPPLVRDIAIEFSALSLADPQAIRFRYRLEGHDNDWQEAVDRRLVSYTNLPPGNYRFRVKAANNSGVWNEEGAQLDFSIQPAIYQTTWFRVACVLLLIGLAGGGLQLWLHMRIRRLQRQFEATLEARVAERTRIARDLHDTLLQRFHGLLLQFQAALNLLPDRPRDSKQVLASAIDQVAEAITEGRDTVQGLRASTLETNNLPESLRALAEDLAHENGHAATIHVDVQGAPQALHPLVRDETFRIAGEALRNAYRHAGARQIEVSISYDVRQLRVRVRDDGKGIDPDVLRAGSMEGHFGLGGMRERAELVGGTLDIRSDRGTEVDLCIPGARAYSRPAPARSWLISKKRVASGEIRE